MKAGRAQAGVSVILLLVVIALVAAGTLAAYVLTRLTQSFDEGANTVTRLQRAGAALEAYVGSAKRLPCPANPAVDDGLEVPALGTTCTYPEGTLPWKTVGMRRDDAYDDWANKISYRVYHGAGGLTQPRGMDMSHCDTVQDSSPIALGANKLCDVVADPYAHGQRASDFLAGKGLRLTDMALDYTNCGASPYCAAFVIVSHGPTGLGAYTVSGVRNPMPSGVERNNTQATGPFTIQAFSDPDTSTTAGTHFDDLLFYRTIPELARRAGLAARDWPEGARFDNATMLSAVGSTNAHTGRNSFTYGGNTFRAFGDNEFSYSSLGGTTGIGVSDSSGTDWAITLDEFIQVDFAQTASRMAITLAGFGYFDLGVRFREQVNFRLFNGSSAVGTTVVRRGCKVDGGNATFVVGPSTAGATFNRVEIQPDLYSPNFFGVSAAFLVAEIAACGSTAVQCTTSLQTAASLCATPTLTGATFSPAAISSNGAATLSITITNAADDTGLGTGVIGMGLSFALPAGLKLAATPAASSTCGSPAFTAVAGAASFAASGLSIADGTATCLLQVNVTNSTTNATGSFTVGGSGMSATNLGVSPSFSAATLTIN